MKAGIKLEHGGKTREVIATPPDFIAWERRTKRKTSDLATLGVGVEDLAYLAWASIRRGGEAAPDFDVWLEELEAIEMIDTPDPKATRKGASKGSS